MSVLQFSCHVEKKATLQALERLKDRFRELKGGDAGDIQQSALATSGSKDGGRKPETKYWLLGRNSPASKARAYQTSNWMLLQPMDLLSLESSQQF